MATRSKHKPIRLHFESSRQVVVVPEDNDIFITTANAAARACKQSQAGVEWSKQWNDFLVSLNKWCSKHGDKVEAGYVTIGDSALNVLICLKRADYDFELEDELAELDLSLSREYPMVVAEVIQIPNQNELRAGLDEEAPVVVYGDGSGAPAASRT
jgi:hypothetical protein